MCYYHSRITTSAEFDELLAQGAKLAFSSPQLVIYKGFDYNYMPVMRRVAGTRQTERVKMQWGFLPSYLKDRDAVSKFRFGYKDDTGYFHKPYTTLNATSEELLSKMYKDAAKNRRCLLPSNGFYEWRHVQVVGKSGKLLKTPERFPYLVQMKNEPEFYMAAIWNPWFDPDSKMTINSFAIVTTQANSLMKQIHNSKERMPTILPGDLAETWLYNDLSDQDILDIANYQCASAEMVAILLDKDFLKSENPHAPARYKEVPDLVYN